MKTYTQICKQAGIYADVAGSMVTPSVLNVIPPVGAAAGLANTVGSVVGAVDGKMSEQERKRLATSGGASFVPGIGASRVWKKLKDAQLRHGGTGSKTWSQLLGNLTAPLVTTLGSTVAGAGIGAGIGKAKGDAVEGRTTGALIGAGAGLVASSAAQLFALILAAAKKTRSNEAQKKYLQSGGSTAANYLLPGAATYNFFKRTGRIHNEENEIAQMSDKEKAAKSTADALAILQEMKRNGSQFKPFVLKTKK